MLQAEGIQILVGPEVLHVVGRSGDQAGESHFELP
jgi:hypothetical protein